MSGITKVFDVWKLMLSILYKYGPVPSVAVTVMVDVLTVLFESQTKGVVLAETAKAKGSVTV